MSHLKTVFAKYMVGLARSMGEIMSSEPRSAHPDCIALWDAMDVDEELFGEFWGSVNPEQRYLEDEKGVYHRWRDEAGRGCEGFVTAESVLAGSPVRHGYVRMCRPDGDIVDATFKRGVPHGIYRRITAATDRGEIRRTVNVSVIIFRNGEDVADFRFDQRFLEQSRVDIDDLFSGLKPVDFKKEEYKARQANVS